MKQKYIQSILSILALCSSINIFAYDFEVNGIYYTITDAKAMNVGVTSGDKPYSGDVVIPESVTIGEKTYTVTGVQAQAFLNNNQLSSIKIGDNVNFIGYRAFYGCTSLTEVVIPNNVTTLGVKNSASDDGEHFRGCTSLTSVTIGAKVKSMGNYSFTGCSSLTNVTIKDGCKYIGHYCFWGCKALITITIPNSVETVGTGAFQDCTDLEKAVIGDRVTSIGQSAFSGCTKLSEVKLGEGLNTIGYRAFYGCTSLAEVVIPDNVITLGVKNSASDDGEHFRGCTSLTTVTIGAKVKSMGHYTFTGCSSLTNVTIKKGCTYIGSYCFWGCTALTSITIPNSVETVGAGAFSGCKKLKIIDIPESVDIIGDEAFYGCTDLEKAVIGDGVYSLGQSAFSGCTKLSEVKLGEGLNTIGYRAFYGCTSLAEVVIPDNVTTLGVKNSASDDGEHFRGCTSLTSVTIGAKVKSMGYYSFTGCSSLTNVTIKEGCTYLGQYCFSSCTLITSVTIPNSVRTVAAGAFYGCKRLKSIDIPKNVDIIGDEAFYGCTDLEKAVIGDGVYSLGKSAFSGCTKLSEVKLGEGLNNIGYRAFYGCTSLVEVVIPDNVTTLGVKNSASDDGEYFRGCTSLTSVTIGSKVKSMGYNAFTGCSNLTRVIIKNGCQIIGQSCFSGCDKIKQIYNYCTDIPSVKNNAFSNYNATLYVTKESVETYKATSPWSEFTKIDTVPYVKYMIDDLFTGEEQLFVINDTIVPIDKPEKIGYTFYGWDDIPTQMPTTDVVVKGKFVINTYNLTYLVNGTEYKKFNLDYNTSITPEATPEEREGYTFSGWSEIPTVMPAKDVTVTGTFNINRYVIKYIINGVEFKKETLEYGSAITPPRTDGEGNKVKWDTYPEKVPAANYEVKGTVINDFVWLTVKDGQSGSTKIRVAQGDSLMLSITAEEGWKVLSVTMDGNDVTEHLSDGNAFTTPVLMSDAIIAIVYEQDDPSAVVSGRATNADIKVVDDGVVISDVAYSTRCAVFSTDGKQIVNTTIEGHRKISLQKGQVYILTLGNRTLKFSL